jgi:hypothetical protein
MTGAISIATKTASNNISFEQGKAPETFRGFLMSTGDDFEIGGLLKPPVFYGT